MEQQDPTLKRNYWMVTLANQSQHTEIIYRADHMMLLQEDLIKIKTAGAAQLGVEPDKSKIVHSMFLGYMSEEQFLAGTTNVEDGQK